MQNKYENTKALIMDVISTPYSDEGVEVFGKMFDGTRFKCVILRKEHYPRSWKVKQGEFYVEGFERYQEVVVSDVCFSYKFGPLVGRIEEVV